MRYLISVIALLVASQAQAATAYWTGEIEFITTVTYKVGVRCGYQYAGQTFYMVFTGSSCPSRVEVN